MSYTGIGSRNTPKDVLEDMRDLGSLFARMDLTLRSGGAPGADTAFETGCSRILGTKEIYLPWKNFEDNPSPLHTVTRSALETAEKVWNMSRDSSFKYLKQPIKLLMARNAYQIAGKTLDEPSLFVVCWTPDGCIDAAGRTKQTGGTGQAIAHASYLGIPVFNLQREHALDELIEFVEKF